MRHAVIIFVVSMLAASSSTVRASTAGTPILWRDPGEIETLDLAAGPGGANGPVPPFQFVNENLSGTTAKIRVVDANGVAWMVKFGEEARPQVFAARLAWALGYFALPIDFVPHGTIVGAGPLTRAAKYVSPDGRFTNASFQLYLDTDIRWHSNTESWSWNANPFVGTHELNGLKILVMLLSDWDNKDARDVRFGSNTAILEYPDGEARYVVADWGGSMGTWGGYLNRSKWNCTGFTVESRDFVKVGHNQTLMWRYSGQHTYDFTAGIQIDDVRWLLSYLGRISDIQLHDALTASGAGPAGARCFATSLRKRIDALQKSSGIPQTPMSSWRGVRGRLSSSNDELLTRDGAGRGRAARATACGLACIDTQGMELRRLWRRPDDR
jgi:hypothetical protein